MNRLRLRLPANRIGYKNKIEVSACFVGDSTNDGYFYTIHIFKPILRKQRVKIELHTGKVKLRAPEKSDATSLYYLRTHPLVNKFIKRDLPKNISDVEKFIELRNSDANPFYFIIETLSKNEFAGTICLWNINKENNYAEVGYELLPDFQSKGIMTSALRKIINLAFTELHIETIEALTHSENLASRKLLEKFDFKLMSGKTDPDNSNNIIYCLKKPD